MITIKSILQWLNSKHAMGEILLIASLIMFNIMCNTPTEPKDDKKEMSASDSIELSVGPTPNTYNPDELQVQPSAIDNLNPDLFGVWKTSEVLGDGYGESLASEAFMEFREDGKFLSWAGRAAGVGSSWEEDRENAVKGNWKYADKTLYLIDPNSGEEATVSISISGNRFMLSGGGDKKVFVKVAQ